MTPMCCIRWIGVLMGGFSAAIRTLQQCNCWDGKGVATLNAMLRLFDGSRNAGVI